MCGDSTENNYTGIAKTTDGNIVVDAYSYLLANVIGPKDSLFSSMAKLNPYSGNIIWSRNYHNPAERSGSGGIFATKDGGIVEKGLITNSIFDGSTYDVLVSKFDAYGKQECYKSFGGSNYEQGTHGGYEDINGNLNILCQTVSTDGDIKKSDGGLDTWIIELGRCGNYIADNASSTDDATAVTKNNTTTLLAYPNPVSNSATISFSLQQAQKVDVTIYNMNGRLIKILANAQMQQGTHQLTWNAKSENVIAGTYLVKLQIGDQTETKTISVVR